jgi:hypothetical protein
MATYFVHPRGTGNTCQQFRNPETPAPNLQVLFEVISDETLREIDVGLQANDEILVTGEIRGTQSNPYSAYAIADCRFFTNLTGGVTIRNWESFDPQPNNPLLRPMPKQGVLRGDIRVSSVFVYNPTDETWSAELSSLPSVGNNTYTAPPSLSAVIYNWAVHEPTGKYRGHLRRAATAADVQQVRNSWHFDQATKILKMRITDADGNPIDETVSPPLHPSNVTSFMLNNVNSLLTVQRPVGWVIKDLYTANAYAAGGAYQISTENAQGCTISNCISLDAAGHHYFGHTGDTAPSAPDTVRNKIENCVGNSLYGAPSDNTNPFTESGFACPISCNGPSAADFLSSGNRWYVDSPLDPTGEPLYPVRSRGATSMGSGSKQNFALRFEILRDRFDFLDSRDFNANGRFLAFRTKLPDEVDLIDPTFDSLPCKFTECTFTNAAPLVVAADVSTYPTAIGFRDCVFTTRASDGTEPAIEPTASPYGFGLGIADPSAPRRVVVMEACTIVMNLDHPQAFFTSPLFILARHTTLIMRGCVIIDTGARAQQQQAAMFFYYDDPGNAKGTRLSVTDSLIYFANLTGTRRLVSNDLLLNEPQDNARQFDGNCYVNVNLFSNHDQFVDQANFISPSGVDRAPDARGLTFPVFIPSVLTQVVRTWWSDNPVRTRAIQNLLKLETLLP